MNPSTGTFAMTTISTVSRLALLACTALASTTMFNVSANAANIPTGAPRSPLLNGTTPFSQKLLLMEEFGLQPLPTADSGARLPVPAGCTGSPGASALDNFLRQPLSPAPQEDANEWVQNPWRVKIAECLANGLIQSPIEGRPPGVNFAHQRFDEFYPTAYFQSATAGARANTGLRDSRQMHHYAAGTEFGPGGLYYNLLAGTSGPQGTTSGIKPRLHPKLPVQNANSLWTFDGTFPAKLAMTRYGEPVLFRHYNALPISPTANRGFGIAQMSTHLHNGHTPGESDGFAGAYFFPGQYYDYRWPMILSAHDRINTDASGPKAGTPDGLGGIVKMRGNWQETMSTLWFHDHRIDHTAENVYKGMAAMLNIYSAVDRGREGLACHHADPVNNINLCLPSGTHLDWGNRDYDVNLSIADKAWDSTGQLYFNLFNTDGFLGDRMTVNWNYNPFLEVRPRRYRFRMLNASVSRYYKIALVTAAGKRVPFHMIANDGNIMEHAVRFPNAESQDLPLQGIAERFDIIVDFSAFPKGTKLYFVNLAEHEDGSRPKQFATLADAIAGRSADPGVGKFLEFRVAAASGQPDLSMNPADYEEGKLSMVTRPVITPEQLAGARHRHFEFGRSNGTDENPWTIKTDGGRGLTADPKLARVSAALEKGAIEIWHLRSGDEATSGGWSHPVHIHFEEGQILSRDGNPPPAWERFARKDVFNVGRLASTEVQVALRFEDFLGTYMEHCHNTQHEDHAMLLRFDVNNPGSPMLVRAPLPDWNGVSYANSYILSE
jgi:FtsP/CotA-like multicopper oxidase with cupredoxin domain